MVDAGDALIALWDGKSRGTLDIVKRARQKFMMHIWLIGPDGE